MGLDSITYLPDMMKEMSYLIYDHLRYTIDLARMERKTKADVYDKYDITNNSH